MSSPLSPRRLFALCRKEWWQILRDPSSGLMAFALPLVMLIIFSYGISLDVRTIPIGVLNEDGGPDSVSFVEQLSGSHHFGVRVSRSRAELDELLADQEIRGYVTLESDFTRRMLQPGAKAPVQVITDGTEPNTASFVAGAVRGTWRLWLLERFRARGIEIKLPLDAQDRYWYNPSAISRYYLIPGSITIIMTVIGALLTSLVVAREWERGTMEALLASSVTRAELLLSKLIPYYLLGIFSMTVVVLVAVFAIGVPFRGSVSVLFLVTSLFLFSVLGIGLLLSTTTRNQFNAAQSALNVAFLPAVMLSGAFFELSSMPAPLRMLTYLLPPRYFVSSLQTLFLSGDVWPVLLPNIAFLSCTSVLFLTLVARKTTRRLDG